jgi:uncharacterized membrane protein
MKGEIVGFDPDSNTGMIMGEDAQRYDFVRLEWRGPSAPRRGSVVDFVAEGWRATQIYPVVVQYDAAEADTAKIVYILYLVSLLVGLTAIVGLIMAYVNRGDAPDWVQSHYRFQIRTFWIGLLYGLLSLVTAILVIGIFFGLFTFVWWIVRCAKGLKLLARGEPYEKATTWLW